MMTAARCRQLIMEDLKAMSEGETLTPARIVLRMAVHARWRAVPLWRVAQLALGGRLSHPIALWLTDRILATSGAELQPRATVGGGLTIKHTAGLVVGGDVVAGRRLTLHQNVTLGDRHPFGGQPHIGDDVTIGAGACVLGPISIGDGAVIAANAVVLQDIPAGCVAAGVPARVLAPPTDHWTSNNLEANHAYN